MYPVDRRAPHNELPLEHLYMPATRMQGLKPRTPAAHLGLLPRCVRRAPSVNHAEVPAVIDPLPADKLAITFKGQQRLVAAHGCLPTQQCRVPEQTDGLVIPLHSGRLLVTAASEAQQVERNILAAAGWSSKHTILNEL